MDGDSTAPISAASRIPGRVMFSYACWDIVGAMTARDPKGFKVILIILALTLVIFGGWRLVDPAGFYRFSGLELSDDAGSFSEVRGAGGIIMASGIVVALGAFRHGWSRTSVLLAAMVFSTLGLARLLGIALDGSPGAEVIQGMAIELLLGGLALFAFLRYGTERRGPR